MYNVECESNQYIYIAVTELDIRGKDCYEYEYDEYQ